VIEVAAVAVLGVLAVVPSGQDPVRFAPHPASALPWSSGPSKAAVVGASLVGQRHFSYLAAATAAGAARCRQSGRPELKHGK